MLVYSDLLLCLDGGVLTIVHAPCESALTAVYTPYSPPVRATASCCHEPEVKRRHHASSAEDRPAEGRGAGAGRHDGAAQVVRRGEAGMYESARFFAKVRH